MENEETVVETTQEASQTTSEVKDAQVPDLDSILSEFDKEFDKSFKGQVTPDPEQNEVSELRKTVELLVHQTSSGDIDKSVDFISSQMGSEATVPKKVIKAMLNSMAVDDPRLRNAFDQRHADPARWNKVLKSAAKSIQKEFSGLPDRKLTEDRDAVAAVVRGASKQTKTEDEAPSFKGWSDNRFNNWKMTGKDNPNI